MLRQAQHAQDGGRIEACPELVEGHMLRPPPFDTLRSLLLRAYGVRKSQRTELSSYTQRLSLLLRLAFLKQSIELLGVRGLQAGIRPPDQVFLDQLR